MVFKTVDIKATKGHEEASSQAAQLRGDSPAGSGREEAGGGHSGSLQMEPRVPALPGTDEVSPQGSFQKVEEAHSTQVSPPTNI